MIILIFKKTQNIIEKTRKYKPHFKNFISTINHNSKFLPD